AFDRLDDELGEGLGRRVAAQRDRVIAQGSVGMLLRRPSVSMLTVAFSADVPRGVSTTPVTLKTARFSVAAIDAMVTPLAFERSYACSTMARTLAESAAETGFDSGAER